MTEKLNKVWIIKNPFLFQTFDDNFFCPRDTKWQGSPLKNSENFLSDGVSCQTMGIYSGFGPSSTGLIGQTKPVHLKNGFYDQGEFCWV